MGQYGVLVELAARRFTIPLECPCCGAAPDTELAIPLTRVPERRIAADSALELVFPYCTRCVGHLAGWEAAASVPTGVALAAIVAAAVLGIAVHPAIGAAVLALAVPAAYVLYRARRSAARAAMGPSCAGPGRAVAYLGWSGSDSAFELESHAYAARFAEHNQAIVANQSPQLARLLEGNRIARLAVPTPAAAVHTVPPPATVTDWIGRIEGAAGAVARRHTLQRALDALHEPRDRQQVIAAAAQREVAPVIAEVEGLSRLAARGRLQRAIEAARADNLPEELQTAVLRDLDTRWRALA